MEICVVRILLLFWFSEGVGLEFSVVEHWKSIIQKMQIEVSFKAWLWLVHAKNMGGKCIWDYSNSTKDCSPSQYYRIVQGNLRWGWVKDRVELKHPIFWPPHVKSWLIRKDPDAGKNWRQEEKGTAEDEMVGWHLWLNGHEFEQALGVGDDGQGSLACCSPWGCKVLDTTDLLNWSELRVEFRVWL